jgi:hypothetical protein
LLGAKSRAPPIFKTVSFSVNQQVHSTDSLAAELAQSREELLELAARVQRLIGRRGEREALIQRLHRTATLPAGKLSMPCFNVCSLCATGYAELAIHQVRGAAPEAKCDHCGSLAIVWIQLKSQAEGIPQPAGR